MLSVSHVSKQYGTVAALSDVSLDFHPGTIHAVLGENGAGKSTLMGILGGFVRPDSGTVTKAGHAFPLGRPATVRRLGVAMVHQHFTLVPAFTIAETLAMSRVRRLDRLHRAQADAAAPLDLARQLGWQINPSDLIRDLPVGVQQRVEILKALAAQGDTLILDEPTAVLSPDEVDDLFRVLRQLRDQGQTVLLIAHKLSEVLAIADTISVLRHGKLVATTPRVAASAIQLETWMVGEAPQRPETSAARSDPISSAHLRARDVHITGDRGEPAVRGASFDIASGQVLGFGGVDGNGQAELGEALCGLRPIAKGTLAVPSKDPAYIPQDRQTDGLALSMSLLDNFLVTGHRMRELRYGPFLRPRAVWNWSMELMKRFDVRTRSPRTVVGTLSGGNQQKVVLARGLDQTPVVLVASSPSRGLDVKATAFVHGQIAKCSQQGAIVALFSTDRDELDALAQRKTYMSRGVLSDSIGGDA